MPRVRQKGTEMIVKTFCKYLVQGLFFGFACLVALLPV